MRLIQQPSLPVRVLLPNLLHLRPPAPPGTVIVPNDFDFRDFTERASIDELLGLARVIFTAVLRSDLNDPVGLHERVAGGFGVGQIRRHRLFAIHVFARFEDGLQVRSVLEIRGGYENRIHVLQFQQLLHVLEGAWPAAVVLLAPIGRAIAVDAPQIAYRSQLEVVFVLELSGHAGEFRAAVADTDMADGNPVVGADDTAIG